MFNLLKKYLRPSPPVLSKYNTLSKIELDKISDFLNESYCFGQGKSHVFGTTGELSFLALDGNAYSQPILMFVCHKCGMVRLISYSHIKQALKILSPKDNSIKD